MAGFLRINARQRSTFTWGDPILSSTLSVFTSEFGMDQVVPARHDHRANRSARREFVAGGREYFG